MRLPRRRDLQHYHRRGIWHSHASPAHEDHSSSGTVWQPSDSPTDRGCRHVRQRRGAAAGAHPHDEPGTEVGVMWSCVFVPRVPSLQCIWNILLSGKSLMPLSCVASKGLLQGMQGAASVDIQLQVVCCCQEIVCGLGQADLPACYYPSRGAVHALRVAT